jgi:hypothetical protein
MKNLIFACFILLSSAVNAQHTDVVKDTVSFKEDANNIEMYITLDIDSSWIVYDSIAGEDGPIPFSILLEEPSVVVLENIKKPKVHKKHDELFEMDLYYLKGTVTYVVRFSKKAANSVGVVNGSYEFMSCNSTSGVCLPPSQHTFSYVLGSVIK